MFHASFREIFILDFAQSVCIPHHHGQIAECPMHRGLINDTCFSPPTCSFNRVRCWQELVSLLIQTLLCRFDSCWHKQTFSCRRDSLRRTQHRLAHVVVHTACHVVHYLSAARNPCRQLHSQKKSCKTSRPPGRSQEPHPATWRSQRSR